MKYIKVGFIVNTFGLRGELKVESLTDFPERRFRHDQELYIRYEEKYVPVILDTVREHKGFLLLRFRGLDNINLVEKFKNCELFISRDDIQALENGHYYYFELRGCQVYENNCLIGTVKTVEGDYQPLLRIETETEDVLVPYVPAFIRSVSIPDKRIDVSLIEGLR